MGKKMYFVLNKFFFNCIYVLFKEMFFLLQIRNQKNNKIN